MKPIIHTVCPVPPAVAAPARGFGLGLRSCLRTPPKIPLILAAGLALAVSSFAASEPAPGLASPVGNAVQVSYKTTKVGALDIFYREAGRPGTPVVVLLHGFPTSSHMF